MILPDRWRSSHKGSVLKPASLPNSLYWAYWVWVRSHLQWKTPPKLGPYNHNSNFPNITTTLNSKYMKKIFWILKYIVYFRHYTMKYFINHKISIGFNWESKVWSICLFPKYWGEDCLILKCSLGGWGGGGGVELWTIQNIKDGNCFFPKFVCLIFGNPFFLEKKKTLCVFLLKTAC